MPIVPLDATLHGRLRVGARPDIAYGAAQNHAVLGLSEIPTAAADYPLCMMKDGQTGQFNVVALFGFEPGRNLYVISQHWLATWVPGTILRYPFYRDDNAPHRLAIELSSPIAGDTRGTALFDGAAPTDYLRAVADMIERLVDDVAAMQRFAAALVRADVVRPLDLVLTHSDGHEHQIDGLYSIDPFAAETLADDALLSLHRYKFLAPMHILAASLAQLDRLRQLHDHAAAKPIVRLDYRVRG